MAWDRDRFRFKPALVALDEESGEICSDEVAESANACTLRLLSAKIGGGRAGTVPWGEAVHSVIPSDSLSLTAQVLSVKSLARTGGLPSLTS